LVDEVSPIELDYVTVHDLLLLTIPFNAVSMVTNRIWQQLHVFNILGLAWLGHWPTL